jgi:hypothetical protein
MCLLTVPSIADDAFPIPSRKRFCFGSVPWNQSASLGSPFLLSPSFGHRLEPFSDYNDSFALSLD